MSSFSGQRDELASSVKMVLGFMSCLSGSVVSFHDLDRCSPP